MPQPTYTIRILVVRSWTELGPLRAALRELGCPFHLTVADIEPALNAALARATFDVIVFDATTPAIARDTLAARMRDHSRDIPIVEITRLDALPAQILRCLASRKN